MKRILAAAIMLVALMGLKAGGETIKGSDGRITCIGRAEIKDGNHSFDWTGVYMRVRFQGSSLAFKVSDTKKDYYNIWLDSSMET